MSFFDKLENFFNIAKSEWSKIKNDDEFKSQMEQTQRYFKEAEENISDFGNSISQKSKTLVEDFKNLSEKIGAFILSKGKVDIDDSTNEAACENEWTDLGSSMFEKVKTFDFTKKEISKEELADLHELKTELEHELNLFNEKVSQNSERAHADIRSVKKEMDESIEHLNNEYKGSSNADERIVYEAKVVDIQTEAKSKVDRIMEILEEDNSRLKEVTDDFKTKAESKFSTHWDKLKETSASINNSFDRLLNKIKDTMGDH